MYELGVIGVLWNLINDCYTDTESAVICNMCQSKFFPVCEGIRQGGVLSGLLYLVFIDELISTLEKSNLNTGILSITSCVPSLADDVACISTSLLQLQRMLDICFDYSRRWRFQFNAGKSSILQFSPNLRDNGVIYPWCIGNERIPIATNYTHLGVDINSNLNSSERIMNCCRKRRNSFFALNGISSKSTNPEVLVKLYKTIILPSVLYGCEIWGRVKASDLALLNKLQHFIVKRILDLPKLTRSDMCQSLVGLFPIAAYIDQRKLMFLQKLCTMKMFYLSKDIFVRRLFSYFIDYNHNHFGFIPDIVDILSKYDLNQYLLDYISDGQFPGKMEWKVIVRNAVSEKQIFDWNIRINNDTDFSRFIQLHDSIKLVDFWRKSKSFPEVKASFLITKLWTVIPNSTADTCTICMRQFSDVYVHACCNCTGTFEYRELWWNIIVENFPVQLFVEFSECDEETLYQFLLGRRPNTLLENDQYVNLYKLCHAHVIQCLTVYNRLR